MSSLHRQPSFLGGSGDRAGVRADDAELDALGLRDWLDRPGCWLLTEWPERAPAWLRHCDVVFGLTVRADDARVLTPRASSATGQRCVFALEEAAAQLITDGFKISCD